MTGSKPLCFPSETRDCTQGFLEQTQRSQPDDHDKQLAEPDIELELRTAALTEFSMELFAADMSLKLKGCRVLECFWSPNPSPSS